MTERADEYAPSNLSRRGKPIRLSTGFDAPGSIDNAAYFAGAARHLQGTARRRVGWDHSRRCGGNRSASWVPIAPWNYPPQMAMWKMLPAVAAGNTVVLKPSEAHP